MIQIIKKIEKYKLFEQSDKEKCLEHHINLKIHTHYPVNIIKIIKVSTIQLILTYLYGADKNACFRKELKGVVMKQSK